jgi:type I restriction enzyme S subunit
MEVKPGYKQTEVGVIPEDWEVKTLISLSDEIGDGIHATPNYSNASEFFFINGNNLKNGKIIISTETKSVNRSEFEKLHKKLTNKTLLISINGTIGNLAYYSGEKIVLGKSAAYINLKNSVSQIFIYYFLSTEIVSKYFENELTGTTISNLSLFSLRNTPIAISNNIAEQTAIATALSDVDALISGLDRLIEKKRAIKQAALQELLTGKRRLPGFDGEWMFYSLADIASINMGQSPDSKYYNQRGNGLPLIQGNADIENKKTIIRVFTSQITKTCNQGDIILTVRAPVGAVGISMFKSCIGRGVCSVIPFEVSKAFLFHALMFNESKWKILEQGSTFTSANSSQIAEFKILMPLNNEEQTAIATVLSDMDAEISALETRRAKTLSLKQGMMQELLTGRIRLV